jgi:hypothetical protein
LKTIENWKIFEAVCQIFWTTWVNGSDE